MRLSFISMENKPDGWVKRMKMKDQSPGSILQDE